VAQQAISLRPATLPLDGFDELLAESLGDGHDMLQHLSQDWQAGSNRFSRTGELLLSAYSGARLVGVCGRNIDPYSTQPRIGRVRRLYVRRDARRLGIGRDLVHAIIANAHAYFDAIHVRAPAEVFPFYQAMGFERVEHDAFATHRLVLRSSR
jgi:GNAT superfamily N-acetyltransferase